MLFSFIKTKRGFTLVELMIVVVIMAILVAVAVPIYFAVTSNAKKRTCIDNQKQIVSSISNYVMTKQIEISATEEVRITTGVDNSGIVTDNGGTVNASLINSMFRTLPICPVENNVLVVTISPVTGNDATSVDVNVKCEDGNGAETAHNS